MGVTTTGCPTARNAESSSPRLSREPKQSPRGTVARQQRRIHDPPRHTRPMAAPCSRMEEGVTLLIAVGVVVLWAPVHAYGMGRYRRALKAKRKPFDPASVRHDEYCCMNPRWRSLRDLGCDKNCVEQARAAHDMMGIWLVLFWPVVWPLRAALDAGERGGKPILTHAPDEIEQAFKVLDDYLDGEKSA